MCKSVALCGIVWQVLDRAAVGVYICHGFGACFGGWPGWLLEKINGRVSSRSRFGSGSSGLSVSGVVF